MNIDPVKQCFLLGCVCHARAYIITEKEDCNPSILTASRPRPWPRLDSKYSWNIEASHDGDKIVWASSAGRLLWTARPLRRQLPAKEGLLQNSET